MKFLDVLDCLLDDNTLGAIDSKLNPKSLIINSNGTIEWAFHPYAVPLVSQNIQENWKVVKVKEFLEAHEIKITIKISNAIRPKIIN